MFLTGIKKIAVGVLVSLVGFIHSHGETPVVHLDESFTGADRITQDLPERTAWFCGTETGHLLHDANAGTLTLLSAENSSRHVVAYLNESGDSPIELEIGETLRLTYVVSFTNPNLTETDTHPNNSFRVGLFDSRLEGTNVPRIDADDLGGVSRENSPSYFDSYVGYRFDSVLHEHATANPARIFRRNPGTTGKALLVLTTAYSGSLAGAGKPTNFSSDTYLGEITITRTGSSEVSFSHRLYHPDPEVNVELSVHGSDTDPNAVHSFDTIAFGLNSRVAEAFTLHEVVVTVEEAAPVEVTVGSRTVSTTKFTPEGTPVVPMWNAPMPTDDLRNGAGFPILENAEHAVVWQPQSREEGAYNHYATLVNYHGRFFAMWGNHPLGEDGPGQRILFAYSDEWGEWSEAQELFPPPGPIKERSESGIHLKPERWIEIDGHLYAVAFVFEAGFYGIARRVRHDGTYHTPFIVFDPPDDVTEVPDFMEGVDEPWYAESSAAKIREWYEENGMVSWWGRYASTNQGVPRFGIDDASLIESFSYRTKDGGLVLFARNWGTMGNPVHNNRMYVTFDDGSRNWEPLYPTDIPDSPSRADAIVLDDGTVLLIGNQNVSRFDQPVYLDRDPITISISDDGYTFDRVFALRTGSRSHYRFSGIGGRNHGFAYSNSIVHDGWLYTLYSVSKEDMEISRVRLSEIVSEKTSFNLRYDTGPGGRIKFGEAFQEVQEGDDGTEVEVEGLLGAVFSEWSDGVADNPRLDTEIGGDLDVTAFFRTESGTPIAWFADYGIGPAADDDWNIMDGRDTDGDGMTNRQEYIAGTDPANPQDVFRVSLHPLPGEEEMLVRWNSVHGRIYDLLLSESLDNPEWSVGAGRENIAATPPFNEEILGLDEFSSPVFFRVRVRRATE